jgi:hypothetical protein
MQPKIHQLAVRGWRQRFAMLLAGLAVFCLTLIAAGPAPLQAASQITEVLLGDKSDANGVVEKNQDKFTPTTAEIKGTVYIAGAVKGKKVIVELIYATQNLKVLTMPEDLSSSGEVTFTFALPKPEKGWPKGDYKLMISTSDGAAKEVSFQVR